MSSIDERIVQMQFENSQFEKGVQQTLKSLKSLKDGLDLDDSSQSLEKLQKLGNSFSLSKIADSVENLTYRFSALGQYITNVETRLINLAESTVRSLSIDQISAGWVKYGQKTSSVQTIINATGKSIDEVNGYLDKLMWFSDETSYGFTDMTSALGQLTTAGGDIDDLIPMIEGIANATAFAGKTSAEFSRSIYNLNQSYSAGYLQYMDWKSLELAGVASKDLKQAFIDQAIALGKLTSEGKTSSGTLVTLANFGTTLSEKWADTEVMEAAFGYFAEMTEKAYELVQSGQFDTASEAYAYLATQYEGVSITAAKAAQEAKTFTEALDATKDAVSSGWMRTFEIIFGNYEEAKVMWTDLANFLWEVFASGADERNELLQEWKDLGGRADLLQGITDILETMWTVVSALKDSFHDFFPQATVDNLLAISTAVKDFGASFKAAFWQKKVWTGLSEQVEYTTTKVNGLTEANDELKKGTKGDNVTQLQTQLQELGYDLGSYGVDGIFGSYTESALKAFQEKMGLDITGVYDEATHEAMKSLGYGEQTFTGLKWAGIYTTEFSDALGKLKRIAAGVFAIFKTGTRVLQFVWNIFKSLATALSPLVNAVISVAAAIGDCFVAFDNWVAESGIFDKWLSQITEKFTKVHEWAVNASKAILNFFGISSETDGATDSLMTFSSLWENIRNSLDEMGILDAFSSAWDKLSSSIANLGETLKPVWESLTGFFSDSKDWVVSKFLELFTGKRKESTSKRGRSKKKSGTTDDDELSVFVKIIDAVSTAVSNVIDFLSKGVSKLVGIANSIGNFFGDLWASIVQSNFVQNGIPAIGNFFSNIWRSVSAFFGKGGGFVSTVSSVWNSIKNFFVGVWKSLGDIFGAGSAFVSTVSSVWEKIKGFFSGIWKSVSGFFAKGGGFVSTVSSVWNSIKNFFVGVWKSLTEFFSSGESFTSKISSAWKAIKSFFSSIWKWISDLFAGSKQVKTSDMTETSDKLSVFAKVSGWLKTIWNSIGDNLGVALQRIKKFLKKWKWLIGTEATLIAIVVSCVKIFRAVSSLIDNISFLKGKNGDGDKASKASDSIADTLLKIAIAIGIVVVALYIFGSMDDDTLKRGGIVLGVVATAVIGIMVAAMLISKSIAKSGGLQDFNESIEKFGTAILEVAGSILLIAISMLLIGKMKTGELIKGALGLVGIMIAIRIFMGSVKNMGGSVKLTGFIQLSIALLIMVGIMKIIAGMDIGEYIKGLLGLIGMMTVLLIFIKVMQKIVGNAGLVKMSGLLLIATSLALLAFTLAFLGTLETKTLVKGLIGIIAICLALKLVLVALSKIDLKTGITAVIMAITLIAIIYVFAKAVQMIQDVDANQLWTLAKSLGVLMAAYGAFILACGIIGPVGVGTALLAIAAIGLVIAAIAGLSKIPGVSDFMKSGAAELGEFIGTFFGSMSGAFNGAKMTSGLKALGATDIDTDNLENTLAAAQMVADFGEGLPKTDILTKVGNFLFGDELTQFSGGMTAFGAAALSLSTSMEGVSIDQTKVEQACAAAQAIADVSNSLDGITIEDAVAQLLVGGSPFQLFCSNMGNFATAIVDVSTALATVDVGEDFSAKVTSAVDAVTPLKTLIESISGITIEEAVANLIAGESPFATFCSNMTYFAASIRRVHAQFAAVNIREDFSTKIQSATDAIQPIVDLYNAIQPISFDEAIANLISGGSPFENFCTNLETFATSVNTAQTSLSTLSDDENLQNNFDKAIAVATSVATFMETVSGMNIEASKGIISTLFTGETNINTVIDGIPGIASAVNTANTEMAGLDIETITSNFGKILDLVEQTATIFTVVHDYNEGTSVSIETGALADIVNEFGQVGQKIQLFDEYTKNMDLAAFTNAMNAVVSFVGLAKQISDEGTQISFSGIENAIAEFNKLFDSDSDNSVNTDDWFEGLDSSVIEGKLSTFTDDVSSSITTAATSLSNSSTDFASAGSQLASSLSQGVSSAVDTSGMTSICQKMISAANGYQSKFVTAGTNFGKGLSKGLKSSKSFAVASAQYLANQVVNKVKEVFDQHSPSKVAQGIGEYFDLGLSNGLTGYAKVVTKSAEGVAESTVDTVGGGLSSLSSLLSENMDSDPVVRPVVDLSDVSQGAKTIDSLIGNNRSISVDTSTSKASAAAKGAENLKKSVQNGSGSQNSLANSSTSNSSVNVNGNFYVRSDQDIHSLASEIASLTKQQQRSLGANY